jgi:coenzyme F420-reducing hydrogenase delta subunit
MVLMMDGKKIVAFCCENSAGQAAGAADAGVHEAVEIVPLPCSGKVEVALVLRALERGHPGVLVLGCPRDNCKYLTGNLRAEKRVRSIHALLAAIGIEEERVQMEYISSVDAHRLAEAVHRMRERLAALPGADRQQEGGRPENGGRRGGGG